MVMASQPKPLSREAIEKRTKQNQADFIKSVDEFGLCLDPSDTSGAYNSGPNNVAYWVETVVNGAYLLVSLEEASALENWPKPPLFGLGAVFGAQIVDHVGNAVNDFARLIAAHFDVVQTSLSYRRELDKGGEGGEYAPKRDVDCRQWLDAILTAAGSDKAGQFMAPINVAKARRSVHDSARALISAISEMDPTLRQDFLLSLAVKAGFPANITDRAKVGTNLADGTLQEILDQLSWLEHLTTD